MNAYFIKSMALFWVFAEMVILVTLLKGIAHVQGIEKRYNGLALFLGFTLAILTWVAFRAEPVVVRVLHFQAENDLSFYKHALWHFFCTMWIVLEGSIMFQVVHAYLLLKQLPDLGKGHGWQQRYRPLWLRVGLPLFLVIVFLLYIGYEYRVLVLLRRHLLDKTQLKQLYYFYIKYCGTIWFMVEAAVAITGRKTYHLLKQRDPLPSCTSLTR